MIYIWQHREATKAALPELSVKVTFYICSNTVTTQTVTITSAMEELNVWFYVILNNLYLSGHTWLVPIMSLSAEL
jgi:intracellular sulfur oxidation DsrE/DsrF family protein